MLDQINHLARLVSGPAMLLVAALMTLVMFVVLRRREELGGHALQNAAASVLVYGFNIVAAHLFMNDLRRLAHEGYAALHIPTLPHDFWQGQMLVIGTLLAIALTDFCDYLSHRVMHTRWGWPSHAAHHSDTHVNAFTTFRVHSLEVTLMSLTYLVVLTWLQLPELIPVLFALRFAHNLYVHLDLYWDHGPLKYLIASPRFHRWHHADVPEAQGKNLANVMPIYDLMFGTYYMPGPCTKPMGALSSGIEDKNPVTIWLYPFFAWGSMIRQSLGRLFAAGRAATRTAPERRPQD